MTLIRILVAEAALRRAAILQILQAITIPAALRRTPGASSRCSTLTCLRRRQLRHGVKDNQMGSNTSSLRHAKATGASSTSFLEAAVAANSRLQLRQEGHPMVATR